MERSRFLRISLPEMDAFFRADKGWVRSTLGREWRYEFKVPKSIIRIQVASSISVHAGFSRDRGDDAIRIWAIAYDGPGRVYGVCQSRSIKRTTGWEGRVLKVYREVLAIARRNLAPLKKD